MAPPRRLHETPMAVEGSRIMELIDRFRVPALLRLLPAFVSGLGYPGARSWCGPTSGNLPICPTRRARGPTASRPETGRPPRRAQLANAVGCHRGHYDPPCDLIRLAGRRGITFPS